MFHSSMKLPKLQHYPVGESIFILQNSSFYQSTTSNPETRVEIFLGFFVEINMDIYLCMF